MSKGIIIFLIWTPFIGVSLYYLISYLSHKFKLARAERYANIEYNKALEIVTERLPKLVALAMNESTICLDDIKKLNSRYGFTKEIINLTIEVTDSQYQESVISEQVEEYIRSNISKFKEIYNTENNDRHEDYLNDLHRVLRCSYTEMDIVEMTCCYNWTKMSRPKPLENLTVSTAMDRICEDDTLVDALMWEMYPDAKNNTTCEYAIRNHIKYINFRKYLVARSIIKADSEKLDRLISRAFEKPIIAEEIQAYPHDFEFNLHIVNKDKSSETRNEYLHKYKTRRIIEEIIYSEE